MRVKTVLKCNKDNNKLIAEWKEGYSGDLNGKRFY